jgi:predicted metalloprotease
MRWEDLPESSNVEDRRDEEGPVGRGGGFGGPVGAGGLGIGGVLAVLAISWALGLDPMMVFNGVESFTRDQPRVEAPSQQRPTGAPKDDTGRFVSRVLGSTEATWKDIFAKDNKSYRAPTLVLFRGSTDARCGGLAQAAMGPFYCPADQKIYLDTSFFNDIERRFRGCDAGSKSCQFAQAYVIAHEVGHHVQNQFGVLQRAQREQQKAGGRTPRANQIQVQVELQADCLAGVWAHHSDQRWNLLQPGDIEAALRTAAAIGDDTLQRKAQGYVVPDSFTHGSAQQRQRWFTTGFKSGQVGSCNTFAAAQL